MGARLTKGEILMTNFVNVIGCGVPRLNIISGCVWKSVDERNLIYWFFFPGEA